MTTEWPMLRLGPGAKWPREHDGRDLLRRLEQVAEKQIRVLILSSGRRGWREQHRAYMDYLHGGTLAAPCCSRHYVHSEADCLRQCASMHCVNRAADVVVKRSGGPPYKSIGDVAGMRHALRQAGLCLPVPGEPWHVQVGSTWRA